MTYNVFANVPDMGFGRNGKRLAVDQGVTLREDVDQGADSNANTSGVAG